MIARARFVTRPTHSKAFGHKESTRSIVTVGKENSGNINIYYKDWGNRQPVVFSHYGGLSLRGFEITLEELGSRTDALHPKRPTGILQEQTTEKCLQSVEGKEGNP